jgi:murein DD-endopeptidase MepM/ murein hydrolase activator NlpD
LSFPAKFISYSYLTVLKNCRILFFLLCCLSCNNLTRKESAIFNPSVDTIAKIKKTTPNLLFGIPADSYKISSGKIRPNGFLPDLLASYGIDRRQLDLLIRNSSKVFYVREMRAHHNYTILSDKDSAGKAKYFIYEHDPSEFYIFSFNDSLNITPYRQKITSVIKYSSGTIRTSLWDAIIEEGLNPELPALLSDIYAWTVDFFGLQKGDYFKVIYSENFIGSNSIGISRIYGAEFNWSGSKIYAIPMIQNGNESYYDTSGNNLRKAFLKAPLRISRISSGFSSGRMHPILRIVRPHYGVDYAAPVGTPVQSIGDGKVLSAGVEEESGRIVRIRHNSVYTTAYMHLSGFGKNIYAGAMVKQGDIVGYVGSSGLSTGPHLDFRFYKNGYPVDPLKVEAPAVEPVLPENMGRFEKIRKVVLSLLGTFN